MTKQVKKQIVVDGIKYELLESIKKNMYEVMVRTSSGNIALLKIK